MALLRVAPLRSQYLEVCSTQTLSLDVEFEDLAKKSLSCDNRAAVECCSSILASRIARS